MSHVAAAATDQPSPGEEGPSEVTMAHWTLEACPAGWPFSPAGPRGGWWIGPGWARYQPLLKSVRTGQLWPEVAWSQKPSQNFYPGQSVARWGLAGEALPSGCRRHSSAALSACRPPGIRALCSGCFK